jgi:hypothetical protein
MDHPENSNIYLELAEIYKSACHRSFFVDAYTRNSMASERRP